MSWPILLVVIGVSFGLGAFWHAKHADALRRNQIRRDVDRIARLSSIDTTYRYSGRDLKRMGAVDR